MRNFILRNRLSGGLVAGEGSAPAAEFGRLAVASGRREAVGGRRKAVHHLNCLGPSRDPRVALNLQKTGNINMI
jgi:hypothetical protein